MQLLIKASLPQNPAQFPSDGIALFATNRVEGDCQNIPCRALKSCLLAKSMSLPNCDLIVLRVAASSGSSLTAGAATAAPVESSRGGESGKKCLVHARILPVECPIVWRQCDTLLFETLNSTVETYRAFSLRIRAARS